MRIEEAMSRWFQMSDEVWERHANPLSVWTRYPCLPVLALAIWSRVWIGGFAWIPVLVTLAWIWLNPRVFPKPSSIDNWASRAVMGERLWLKRGDSALGIDHQSVIGISNVIGAVGLILCIYGLVVLNGYHVVYGLVLTLIGKSWFLDRMVSLQQDATRRI